MAVDYITMTDLIDSMIGIIRDTAGTGADIETFTQANYSKTTFCLDQPDAYKPTSQEDAPFVAFYRNRMGFGESVSAWTYEIELELGIEDESVDTATANVVKQTGTRKLEEFKNLVYDAIRLNIPCNGNIDVATWEPEANTHPFYVGYLTFVISIPKVIGSVIGL